MHCELYISSVVLSASFESHHFIVATYLLKQHKQDRIPQPLSSPLYKAEVGGSWHSSINSNKGVFGKPCS